MPSQILQIQLSLKGRAIRTFNFSEDEVAVGRDPDSHISLDNPGVSRAHARFLKTDGGWLLEDLGSANGTYLNDQPVQRKELRDGDVVRVAKFSLWVTLRQDLRNMAPGEGRAPAPVAYEGTTVLRNDQLARMLESVQQSESERPEFDNVVPLHAVSHLEAPVQTSGASSLLMVGSISFIVGTLMGMLATWFVLR